LYRDVFQFTFFPPKTAEAVEDKEAENWSSKLWLQLVPLSFYALQEHLCELKEQHKNLKTELSSEMLRPDGTSSRGVRFINTNDE